MEPISCEFLVNVPALLSGTQPSEGIKKYVKEQLDRCYSENKDRIAGFILTIGYHRDILGTGYPIAARINKIIQDVNPEMFGRVRLEAFGGHTEDKPDGWVWIRAYFVTGITKP